MLAHRLLFGAIMVVVFVAVVVLDERLAPWYPGWLLLAVIAMCKTALEVVGLLRRTSAKPSVNTVFGGVLALVAANWAPHVAAAVQQAGLSSSVAPALAPTAPALVFAWPLWTFVMVVMFTFVAQSAQFDRPGGTMSTIAGTILAVSYVGLLGSFVVQMRWVGGPGEGLVALGMLVGTAKGADTGAYTFGRIAGRHKLWPRLSPNKTVEGAIGGLVFAVAAAAGVEALARALLGSWFLSWEGTLVYGLVVGTAAQLGDLMESMIKRDCAQKDAGDAVPGFGGVLDVMDSLLFAGPVAYGTWLLLRP
jgi:phosphatidate cytidylyltransferase